MREIKGNDMLIWAGIFTLGLILGVVLFYPSPEQPQNPYQVISASGKTIGGSGGGVSR